MLQVWRGNLPKDLIVAKSAERILFCGWRRDMEDMVMVILQGIYYASTNSALAVLRHGDGRQSRTQLLNSRSSYHVFPIMKTLTSYFCLGAATKWFLILFLNYNINMYYFFNIVLGIGCLFSTWFRVVDVQWSSWKGKGKEAYRWRPWHQPVGEHNTG